MSEEEIHKHPDYWYTIRLTEQQEFKMTDNFKDWFYIAWRLRRKDISHNVKRTINSRLWHGVSPAMVARGILEENA